MRAEAFADFSHDKLYIKMATCNSGSINSMTMKFFVHICLMVELNIPPVHSKFYAFGVYGYN